MTIDSGKRFHFWKEVKRRKVLRSLAIYAGTAFIILEATTIIFPRWNLPEWTIDLVLYLLILGAFVNVIIAWIYDITPDGLQRTLPVEESAREGRIPDSRGWKAATYISLVVIAALVLFNVVGGTKQLHAGDIQSLVILPFDNFTGDDALENMVSGMHSSLITDMGRVGGLQVKSRTSSNAFKGRNMTIPEIASELEADAALETAVTCLGDTICIQFRLVRASGDEEQLWVAEYREAKSQALNLSNHITKQIADEVLVELSSDEETLLAMEQTIEPDAYDAYLKGLYYMNQLSPDGFQMAWDYFQRAIDLDPDWADPYAGMAVTWMFSGFFGMVHDSIATPKIMRYIDQALELDPNSAFAYYAKGVTAVWTEWDWEKGEKAFKRSLELNGNNALCRLHYAHYLFAQRRHDEALIQAKTGLELDPLEPFILSLYAVVMTDLGDFPSAVEHFEKALSISPAYPLAYSNVLRAYRWGSYYDKWIKRWKKVTCWDEDDKIRVEKSLYEKGYLAAVEAILKINEDNVKEGKDCQLSFGNKKMWYIETGEYEKAFACLVKLEKQGNLAVPYMASNFEGYDHFKGYPAYVELLKKYKLPYPKP